MKKFILNYFIILLILNSTIFSLTDDSWYELRPLNSISLRTFSYSADKFLNYYRFYNSYGEFLEKGINNFLQINGSASLIDKFYFNYRFQSFNFKHFYFQHLNASYKNEAISVLYGLDSLWLGNGHHGSLLLSNNSSPFVILRFQTEQPFRIPYVGKFNYKLYHGWLDNFKLIAHRFSWLPFSWLEFGLSQNIVYQQNYKLWEFFKVFTASEENIPGQYFDNDQRASIDIAFHLEFLKDWLPTLKKGKIFFEYGGEDLFAWWQKEDKIWIGPLGFEFFDPAQSFGVQLEFTKNKFYFEYSQNYEINNLFRSVHTGESYQNLTKKWYRKVPYLNNKFWIGHHMGSESDDIYLEYFHKFDWFDLKFYFHQERHGLASSYGTVYQVNPYPEIFLQFGFEIGKMWDNFYAKLLIISNNYTNLDRHPEMLEYVIQKNSASSAFIIGLNLSYVFE